MLISQINKAEGISDQTLDSLISRTIVESGARSAQRILIIPPDMTRFHSRAGYITSRLYEELGNRIAAILPALGTHAPMTEKELAKMFVDCPHSLFRVHDWRKDVRELGRISESWIYEISGGKLRYSYPVQANRLLKEGNFDLIISIGQVVPHEVAGMANEAKNIFVGTGGKEAIDRSHYLGAVCGMEQIMGRKNNPVRSVFEKALAIASPQLPPILWILTVIGSKENGSLALRGYFAGDDRQAFDAAAALSAQENITLLEAPIQHAVVWLDPEEYRSTWLGNKAIYRLRMAMADGGKLIILAPGLRNFGEDPGIDTLIRKFGYRSSAEIQTKVAEHSELAHNLSAAAHLIHGSSEGRFKILYAPGPGMSQADIESVGYEFFSLDQALSLYKPEKKATGWYTTENGEAFFFVQNPALGLWSSKDRFTAQSSW